MTRDLSANVLDSIGTTQATPPPSPGILTAIRIGSFFFCPLAHPGSLGCVKICADDECRAFRLFINFLAKKQIHKL